MGSNSQFKSIASAVRRRRRGGIWLAGHASSSAAVRAFEAESGESLLGAKKVCLTALIEQIRTDVASEASFRNGVDIDEPASRDSVSLDDAERALCTLSFTQSSDAATTPRSFWHCTTTAERREWLERDSRTAPLASLSYVPEFAPARVLVSTREEVAEIAKAEAKKLGVKTVKVVALISGRKSRLELEGRDFYSLAAHASMRNPSHPLSKFDYLGSLGQGSFGLVLKVRHDPLLSYNRMIFVGAAGQQRSHACISSGEKSK